MNETGRASGIPINSIINGMTAARDAASVWLTHCYGMVGVGRENDENSGGGIQTGAVPAPGALGLLAVGASGLGLLRGRKRS